MPDMQLTLSTEESSFLAETLQRLMQDKKIEEHRTRTPSYREGVLREEDLIASILTKLGHEPQ